MASRKTLVLESDVVLMPGLVDSHVHVNEPGHTDWEGFATATAAAAAGGITTLVDMPLNSLPVTVDPAALETKQRAAEGQCHIDVGFLGGVVPGNLDQLLPLHNAGVFGFKCFLADSGLSAFPPVDFTMMRDALAVLAGCDTPYSSTPRTTSPAQANRRCTAAGMRITSRPAHVDTRTSPSPRSSRPPA